MPLIPWEKVSLSKEHGGFGVLDLAMQKFFNSHDLPWVQLICETYFQDKSLETSKVGSFWWKGISKLIPSYKEIAKCTIGNGNTIMLWQDRWSEHILQNQFPELFSFAAQQDIFIKDTLDKIDLLELFHTPLYTQAFDQFSQLQTLTEGIHCNG